MCTVTVGVENIWREMFLFAEQMWDDIDMQYSSISDVAGLMSPGVFRRRDIFTLETQLCFVHLPSVLHCVQIKAYFMFVSSGNKKKGLASYIGVQCKLFQYG